MKLDETHAAHRGMIAYFREANPSDASDKENASDAETSENFAPPIAPYEAGSRPYLGMGSHPDIVKRVWDVLAAALPEDSRAIVFGAPSLVHPHSGIVLAMSFGTSYLLHLPQATALEAITRDCKTRETWSDGTVTELAETFGAGWVFGRWLDEEEIWIRAAFAHLSAS